MLTFKELCEQVKCTTTLTPGVKAPWAKDNKGKPWLHDAWSITLEYQERNFTFPFFTGKAPPKHNETFWEEAIRLKKERNPEKPKVADILECLLSDSNTVGMLFEEFCSEFGYDTDSRRAEFTWKACVESGIKTKRLLGSNFEKFVKAQAEQYEI